MSLKQPLVSICIPTYNRAKYLKKVLDSLACQEEMYNGKVEIIISDNASTDNTEEISKKYLESCCGIRYYKNDENVGNKNHLLSLSRATGELRKLSNDTLIYRKNSLAFLCKTVEKYRDKRPVLFFNNGKALGKNIASEYLCFSDFIMKASFGITWIGAFCLWDTDCVDLFTARSLKMCSTQLWQVWKTCFLLSLKNGVFFEDRFCDVQSVKNKDISYGLYKVFYENYLGILNEYIEEGRLNSKEILWLEKHLLYDFFTGWLLEWEVNNSAFVFSETENIKEKIWNAYKDKPYFGVYRCHYDWMKLKKFIKNSLTRRK